MGEPRTIGLDLAKHVFQVHCVDAEGTTVLRKQLRRTLCVTTWPDRRKPSGGDPSRSSCNERICRSGHGPSPQLALGGVA
jgi:hypothetical protein